MKFFPNISVLLVLFSGCGLIDADIADFDLSLPEKEIMVDTAQWELTAEATLPSVDCSTNEAVCSLGIANLCGADGVCLGTCDTGAGSCDVTVLLNLWHTFDLAAEKPELQEIEGQPLVSVTISRIAYKVPENTMNVATPPMDVYVAPEGVMSPGDPQAIKIGRIAEVAAGELVEDAAVDLTETGEDTLEGFMKNYTVPFNIIVGTNLEMSAGDTVPSGRLSAVVLVTATAGI